MACLIPRPKAHSPKTTTRPGAALSTRSDRLCWLAPRRQTSPPTTRSTGRATSATQASSRVSANDSSAVGNAPRSRFSSAARTRGCSLTRSSCMLARVHRTTHGVVRPARCRPTATRPFRRASYRISTLRRTVLADEVRVLHVKQSITVINFTPWRMTNRWVGKIVAPSSFSTVVSAPILEPVICEASAFSARVHSNIEWIEPRSSRP